MLSMLSCKNLQTPEKTGIREIIKETVTETILELQKGGLLRRYDDVVYSQMSGRLFAYFREPDKDPKLGVAMDKIKMDPYYDVLEQYYHQKLTLDWIAEGYRCDYVTIARNKKRLCLKLNDILEGGHE